MSRMSEPAHVLELETVHTRMTLQRVGAAVVLVAISGSDIGELGDAPFDALDQELAKGSFSLFIDARSTKAASVNVSNAWAHWLRKHRDALHGIHMLTGSRFVRITADFVRRFAELDDAMHIYVDPSIFEEVLESSLARRVARWGGG